MTPVPAARDRLLRRIAARCTISPSARGTPPPQGAAAPPRPAAPRPPGGPRLGCPPSAPAPLARDSQACGAPSPARIPSPGRCRPPAPPPLPGPARRAASAAGRAADPRPPPRADWLAGPGGGVEWPGDSLGQGCRGGWRTGGSGAAARARPPAGARGPGS